MKKLIDRFGRVHTYLRISITDKCNLNCIYCNPADSALRGELSRSILSYEELIRLIKIFVADLGITKIRLTGGEPLVRKNVENLFRMLKEIKDKHPFELGLTTNGILLEDKIDFLKKFGLDKINISLDTLRKERFIAITGADNIDAVFNGINKAEKLGYNPVKINAVIMKGINDDEIPGFIEFVKERNLNIRFIEYMPFTSNGWNEKEFISYQEIKNIAEENYSLVEIECGELIDRRTDVILIALHAGFTVHARYSGRAARQHGDQRCHECDAIHDSLLCNAVTTTSKQSESSTRPISQSWRRCSRW